MCAFTFIHTPTPHTPLPQLLQFSPTVLHWNSSVDSFIHPPQFPFPPLLLPRTLRASYRPMHEPYRADVVVALSFSLLIDAIDVLPSPLLAALFSFHRLSSPIRHSI